MLPGKSVAARAAVVAQVLALSDERDLWLQRLTAAERDAYCRGYEEGRADGRAAKAAEQAAALEPLPPLDGRTFAELQALRYGPGHDS